MPKLPFLNKLYQILKETQTAFLVYPLNNSTDGDLYREIQIQIEQLVELLEADEQEAINDFNSSLDDSSDDSDDYFEYEEE